MDLTCPLMKGPCIQRMCRWWISLKGNDPQDGSIVDKWGCAIEFVPILLVGVGKETRSAGQSVEDFKKAFSGAAQAVLEHQQRNLLP